MSKKFIGILGALVVVFGALLLVKQSQPQVAQVGLQHPNQGQQHIQRGQSHETYNSDPASSGPHYNDSGAPTDWGVYTREVPEEVFVHNEEHGGIIVTYSPSLLAADQLKKLQQLFAPPYSNQKFQPSRFILTPRSKDTHAIELAAWTYTLNFDSYDEATLIQFYEQHVNKSPEAGAQPTNAPIDQATN